MPLRIGCEACINSGMSSTLLSDSSSPLPVAVVGCGRMGRLHARTYSQMPEVRLVGVFDAEPTRAVATAQEYSTRAFDSLEALAGEVAAATIAVSTPHHLETAKPFLVRGLGCLIEKPLGKDSADARTIVELARKHNAMVQVGHIERFNPAVRALEQLQLQPGFIEVSRVSPMTFRSLDVGVVLDMMIHDIEVVLSLARSKVLRVDASGVSVVGPAEDICNARLTFENGCVANITASRLAMKTERRLRVFTHAAYVSVDYGKRTGVIVRRSGNLESIREAAARLKSGEVADASHLNYLDLVKIEPLEVGTADPLRAQLESFVGCVRNKTAPVVSAEDGLAAVDVAEQIVAAMSHGVQID